MAYLEKSEGMGVQQSLNGDDLEPIKLSETAIDAADMDRLGKSQQLARNFRSVSTLGLTVVIMGTWLGMIASSTFGLINGGRAGTLYMYLIVWGFQFPVIASLAEMSSMAPTSAGQYHWVSEFAPPSCQKFLSYVSGWLCALGWQAMTASTAYSVGQFILYFITLRDPDFSQTNWQGSLLTIAIALLAVFFNVFGAKYLPHFETVILFFNVIGFLAVCIPLWVMAPKAQSTGPDGVWTAVTNGGGWASAGAACIVGMLTPTGAFLGVDSAAHMSEECRDASRTVPRVMMITIILNGILGFVGILTYIYSIQSIETQIVESKFSFPFIGIFYDATGGSSAAAIGMTMPWVVIATASTVNCIAAASRQAWSFARDEGLPFSRWFQKVTVVYGTPLPVNSMLASLTITVALALIVIGSTEAFNTICGLLNGAINFSYTFSIACVLWRRLYGAPLPPARFSLGKWGVLINAVGCLFEALTTVISFFPLVKGSAPANWNWAFAMFLGTTLVCMIYYAWRGRKVYKGPVVHVKQT